MSDFTKTFKANRQKLFLNCYGKVTLIGAVQIYYLICSFILSMFIYCFVMLTGGKELFCADICLKIKSYSVMCENVLFISSLTVNP